MEKTNLNILPTGGVLPIVHCSQGDIGRQFQINLYSDGVPYILDGTEELTIDGHKDDNNIFSYSLDPVTGSTITISTEEQMTACAGNVVCEIRIYKGDTRLGTCNFIIQVEEGPSNGIPSASTLQALDEIRAELQEAVEDAEAASEAASDYANTSKNWAVGPNGSGSGTDTNNSKYYSQQSANSATAASNSASAAHTSELNAAASESNAATSESNASISETNASNSATAASNSASAANTSANNASTSATTANNAKNDAVSAKNDAITAKNAAEDAQQKIENMTASASQLPEGSSPTVTKSEVGGVVNLAFGIPKGDTGATGPRGADGLGVPAGGTTGQVLAKASDTDNDTEWITPSSGGGGTPTIYLSPTARYNGRDDIVLYTLSLNGFTDKMEVVHVDLPSPTVAMLYVKCPNILFDLLTNKPDGYDAKNRVLSITSDMILTTIGEYSGYIYMVQPISGILTNLDKDVVFASTNRQFTASLDPYVAKYDDYPWYLHDCILKIQFGLAS
jgi:hypothetical protein